MNGEPNSLIHSFFAVEDDEDEDEDSALTLYSLRRRRGGVRSARVLDLCDGGGGGGDGARRPSCKELGREGGRVKSRIAPSAHFVLFSTACFSHG